MDNQKTNGHAQEIAYTHQGPLLKAEDFAGIAPDDDNDLTEQQAAAPYLPVLPPGHSYSNSGAPAGNGQAAMSTASKIGLASLGVLILLSFLGWYGTYSTLQYRVTELEQDKAAMKATMDRLGNPDQLWTLVNNDNAYIIRTQNWMAAHGQRGMAH